MKIVVSYYVDVSEDDDPTEVELISAADYKCLDSEEAGRIMDTVRENFEERGSFTVDCGGDDERYEFDFAERVFESEREHAEKNAKELLGMLEVALKGYEDDGPEHCQLCNGTGEGQVDGSKCSGPNCDGGVIRPKQEREEPEPDIHDERQDKADYGKWGYEG